MDAILGSAQGYSFKNWLRNRVRTSAGSPRFPLTQDEVKTYRKKVRDLLSEAAGPAPCYDKFNAEIHQVHKRKGYRIEAVSFETFGGLRMTANAYVPESDTPLPGILAVHGHFMHGRRAQGMQKRCAGLALSGYFVLAVDAMGNGERSVNLPGEYHGNSYAAALWLTGYSLFGIQLHENYRACDYLSSRPEVDPSRLGITGASGGGNQSFYSGAWDERFSAVEPVCSTGSYRKLVGSHNCMCETPFALAGSLEEYDIFSMVAPRSLLVISAMVDGDSFRYEDAAETLKKAHGMWKLFGHPEKMEFCPLHMRHGYSKESREICLGWFNRWLKGDKSEKTPTEPETMAEDYNTLSCYPSAPFTMVMTMPSFFADKRKERARNRPGLCMDSVKKVFSSPGKTSFEISHLSTIPSLFPESPAARSLLTGKDGTLVTSLCYWPDFSLKSERIMIYAGNSKSEYANPEKKPNENFFIQRALRNGMSVWVIDLPGMGEGQLLKNAEGCIVESRACHMLGFTLAGYWISILDSIAVTARKESGFISLFATEGLSTPVLAGSPLLGEYDNIMITGPLATYDRVDTFPGIPFEAFIPGLLEYGDIPDFAALRAPRPMTVAAPIKGDGCRLSTEEMQEVFRPVIESYARSGRRESFHLVSEKETQSLFLPDLAE